jgi:hypothetical protein
VRLQVVRLLLLLLLLVLLLARLALDTVAVSPSHALLGTALAVRREHVSTQ